MMKMAEKTGKKVKEVIREVINLITKFVKPYGLDDEILRIPKEVKKLGTKLGMMDLAMTIIALVFAFLLKLTNWAIEYQFIIVGIILFMLYRAQQVGRAMFNGFRNSESKKFELIFDDELIYRSSPIIGKVADKVLKFDPASNIYRIMTNESVLNTIKNYLGTLWLQKIQHKFASYSILSVVVMLIVAIITNTAIPQYVFIPLIVTFGILSFLSSAYISINRKDFYEENKKHNNEQSTLANDLLRVPLIVKQDIEMRINRFQKVMEESNRNVQEFHKKLNASELITALIETLSQYGIIIACLCAVEWSNITLSTIAEITATLAIVETALSYIRQLVRIFNENNERLIIMSKEEEDMKSILEVYYKELKKSNETKSIENIIIPPFEIKYVKESENDNPFLLVSKSKIAINQGEVAILYGPSGSGKSTFMKLLTERIRIEKSSEIPETSRYLFFDEKLKFGSLRIFDELFCMQEDPDLAKMQEILKNLHLWTEINANCGDVWRWMKEKRFGHSLSNGQNQRFILAKMLYWLDKDIDVVVLDECTSGLDDKSDENSADAQKILEYIVRYCNRDKKRIVIISTHQNIDTFKASLDEEYNFKNLYFKRQENIGMIEEIR